MYENDYFDLNYFISLILAIIPLTSVICGIVTRFKEDSTAGGVVRLVIALTGIGGGLLWLCDLVLMIFSRQIVRIFDA